MSTFEEKFVKIYDSYTQHYNRFTHKDIPNWFYPLDVLRTKPEFDFKKLESFSQDINIMTGKYCEYGVIELRPYNNEKILVIGCGNGGFIPLSNYKAGEVCYYHKNEYTINPCILYNPSVVGTFCLDTFYNIPNNSFEVIHAEGIKLFETKTFLNEVMRLLKINGILAITSFGKYKVLLVKKTDNHLVHEATGEPYIRMNDNIFELNENLYKMSCIVKDL